jgi:hypothetical protein
VSTLFAIGYPFSAELLFAIVFFRSIEVVFQYQLRSLDKGVWAFSGEWLRERHT